MQQVLDQQPVVDPTATTVSAPPPGFVDRRRASGARTGGGPERRQFSDSRSATRPEVVELAEAVDQYKLRHRRRFITFEELYDVMISLGYHK